jgi:hypothetical protein
MYAYHGFSSGQDVHLPHIPLVLLSDVSHPLSHTSQFSGSTHGKDSSADRPRSLYFVLVEMPISGSLTTCFDYNDLTSDFDPITPHTRLNGIGPERSQFRHAIRAIVIALERTIGGLILHMIKGIVDPVFHGHGPRHIGGV